MTLSVGGCSVGVTGKRVKKKTLRFGRKVTHQGTHSDRLVARFRASCLVRCEVAAFLLQVRMRFQFVFSPRVGQHRTIKQMCRSSHTLHLTVFPAQQFKIDTTHTTHTHTFSSSSSSSSSFHTREHTHTHTHAILLHFTENRSLQKQQSNILWQASIRQHGQSKSGHNEERQQSARAAQVQSSNNERRSKNQIANNNRYTKYQKQKNERKVKGGAWCLLCVACCSGGGCFSCDSCWL